MRIPAKLGSCLTYFTSRIIWINGRAAVVTAFVVRFMTRLSDVLLWFDAPGLSVFCAIGAAKAMAVTGDPIIGVVMGVITAVAGGILRALLLLTSRLCSAWQRPLLFEALA